MLKNDFLGEDVARLGFGAMRLPVIDGNTEAIDRKQLDEMVDAAIAAGVNYFDTAYPYHGGMSEIALSKSLSRYPHDSYLLATKYPGHQIADTYDPAPIFEEQLKKCNVEHFDFYLLHNIYEASIDVYTDEHWGIADYFVEQKKNGRIHHLGFSCHGRTETLAAYLDYGARKYAELKARDPEAAAMFSGNNIMEFCQIQMNYLDWTFQDAKGKVELLREHRIPVWVMEPVRGGKLAALPEEHAAKLKALRPEEGIPAWSFRFLQSFQDVTVTLSGMSNFEQLEDNIRTYEEDKPLNQEEMDTLLGIADEMLGKKTLPCTACRYCVSHCPQELDIPSLLALYNEHCFTDGGFIAPMALSSYQKEKLPSVCVGCRSCEAVCPQQILISEAMSDFTAKLNM